MSECFYCGAANHGSVQVSADPEVLMDIVRKLTKALDRVLTRCDHCHPIVAWCEYCDAVKLGRPYLGCVPERW